MTTPEENAATVRELIQRVMNEGDMAFAEKTLSGSFAGINPMAGGAADKAGAIAMYNMMHAWIPDMHTEVEDVVATGNKVAVRTTMTGTDTTGFVPGTPSTGKSFSIGGIDVFTFDDAGMNTGHYGVYDMMGAMGQLGLLPDAPS